MSMEHNLDVKGEALSRMISQYQDKPNFTKIITTLMKDFQEFEDSVWKLFSGAGVSTATGAQLDMMGELLAVKRYGRADSTYRSRLQAAIIQYTSSGRWEQVLEGFRLLTGARSTQGEELFPAKIVMTAIGAENLAGVDLNEVRDALHKLKAVGVGLNAALIVADPPFVFAGDPDIHGAGFADANNYSTTGGHFPLTLDL